MQTGMNELTYMRLTVPLTKILTKVDSKIYEKYISKENGKYVIRVNLKNISMEHCNHIYYFGNISDWDNTGIFFNLNIYNGCVTNVDMY